VPIRHWLRDEMYDWARGLIRESQADDLVDLAAAQRMLDAHRKGPVDHSRRIWALLVFLIWHGVFVEQRIRPNIRTSSFPVRV
jgi:asparagine synthase (glutamine-hydrolysing)